MIAFLGKKLGMTRVYDSYGISMPVTVIEIFPGVVIRKKEKITDGYNSIQLGFLNQKKNRFSSSQKGYFRSQNVSPQKILKEVRLTEEEMKSFQQCQELNPSDYFVRDAYVDVSALSKGKGFCGVIKRHNFSRGPETHGSRHHREPGSISSTGPSRVFKGKKLPGRKGNKNVTIQSLKILKIDVDSNLVYIKGSVPGNLSASVSLKLSVKKIKQNKRLKELKN